jgi:hypothetical protein
MVIPEAMASDRATSLYRWPEASEDVLQEEKMMRTRMKKHLSGRAEFLDLTTISLLWHVLLSSSIR